MNTKVVFLIFAVIYFLSPVDLAPGILIDDFIALFIALTPFFKKTTETQKGGYDYIE